MTHPTLTLSNVVLQSLAFLIKVNPAASEGKPLSGLIIGCDQSESIHQIQAIDKGVDWEGFDYPDFMVHQFDKRYDLAVIMLTNDVNTDTQMIQRCRDLFAKHCLVVQYQADTAMGVDMVSFGFSRLHEKPIIQNEQSYQVWQFNLFDYKHLPDWFNSKFWANPELWDQFRW